jgi:hypothetical protein
VVHGWLPRPIPGRRVPAMVQAAAGARDCTTTIHWCGTPFAKEKGLQSRVTVGGLGMEGRAPANPGTWDSCTHNIVAHALGAGCAVGCLAPTGTGGRHRWTVWQGDNFK